MTIIDIIKPDCAFEDERGVLIQLARRGYSQINFVESRKGSVRGGHCHRLNSEAFYIISGCCRVKVRNDEEEEKVEFKKGDFFRIAPGVRHEFEYIEDTQMITMYSLGVELEEGIMDIIP